jgi:gas vesicle protein
MSGNGLPKTLIGFLIGLGAGAALGVLFAPNSGEKTRKRLLGIAQDAVDDAVATGRSVTRRTKGAVGEIVIGVKDATEAVERAYTKATGD